MESVFQRGDDAVVHHLQRRRDDARSDDRRDRLGRVANGIEHAEHRAVRFGITRQPNPDAGNDAEGSLTPHEQPGEIVPGGVFAGTAELDQLTIRQDDLDPEDMIDSDAVLERVRSPGVRRHIAADRTGPLRGGVGGVMISGPFEPLREVNIHHTGLHDRVPVAEIDLFDLPHAGQADHHTAADGERSAGETRAGTAGDKGNLVLVAELDRFDDLAGGGGKDDDVRNPLLDHVTIAFVDDQFVFGGDDVFLTEDLSQAGQQGLIR